MEHLEPIRILFLAAEADPLVKVGGLGDVAGSLPQALRHLLSAQVHTPVGQETAGSVIDIRLAIPYHASIHYQEKTLRKVATVHIPHAKGVIDGMVYAIELDGLPIYLIAGLPFPSNTPVYTSDWSYDAYRYIFFSLAALELCKELKWQPDVVHANDWHTAAAVYKLDLARKEDPFFKKTASIITVHNLPFMGVGGNVAMGDFQLPPSDDPSLPVWARHLPLPLGLLAADCIAAVSPGYAREILTPEFGSGLEEFLKTRAEDICGVLNGIDTHRWDPATDTSLPANYSAETLYSRKVNKTVLQEELGFETYSESIDNLDPLLLGMVTRMDYQKGVDLALDALEHLGQTFKNAGRPWQTVILGTGLPELEEAARNLQEKHPDNVRAIIRFDANLSRRIYAGADIFLMPSRYEPCGLAQMIAMRYGCVPLARGIGGLRDTILDYDASLQDANGFLFHEPTPDALFDRILRAWEIYSNKTKWRGLQLSGMNQDFSWEPSARRYYELYQDLKSKNQ